jgi:MinD-like ATPase involved in chromosome partitioning or flagellar assembly
LPAEDRRTIFLPLFADPHGDEASELLEAGIDPGAAGRVRCVRPPVAGLAFLAAGGELSRMLDVWWQVNVGSEGTPVLLMLHEPELETWISGLDAEFVIGVAAAGEADLYAAFPNVRTTVTGNFRQVTEWAMAHYDGFRPDAAPAAWEESARPGPPQPTPFVPRGRPGQGGQPPGTGVGQGGTSALSGGPDPPAGAGGTAGGEGPGTEPIAPVVGRRSGFASLIGAATSLLTTGARSSVVPAELTTLALSHQAGKIVGVTSRAGGVGKTAIAAGIGIIYGEAVQDSGWCAAVVDQNIGNPDQWGRLAIEEQARTVSEIMVDIEAGREWTVPTWNRTPALAVYPERRDVGDAYAPGQIARFAGQLRQLHMLSVVDLPNRVPAFTSAEAAVCAGWIGVADLVLIPTTDDPNRLLGTLEYLDAPMMRGDGGRPPARVIVPYIRSPLKAIRDNPRVVGLLEQVRLRVLAVVEIPKDEKATLAVVEGKPITEIAPALRDAYILLAITVARALIERH